MSQNSFLKLPQQDGHPIQVVKYHDYIDIFKLNLDLEQLKPACLAAGEMIEHQFKINGQGYADASKKSPYTSAVYDQYNLLSFPVSPFYHVYKGIQSVFAQLPKKDEPHFIQCWLNIFHDDNRFDWHSHSPKQFESWHGYFCVDTEPSVTTYALPGVKDLVAIENKDNQLVISRSEGDKHRTNVWRSHDRKRISIAFDILPARTMTYRPINHWIPI